MDRKKYKLEIYFLDFDCIHVAVNRNVTNMFMVIYMQKLGNIKKEN